MTRLPPSPALPALLLLALVPSSVPDAIHVAPIYSDQATTTKTVFGFHDFVTTVDNTAIVFTPDSNGVAHSQLLNARAATSDVYPTAALQLEQLFQNLDKDQTHQSFIDVAADREASEAPIIQPSKVVNEASTQEEVHYDNLSTEELIIEDTGTITASPASDENNIDTTVETIIEDAVEEEEVEVTTKNTIKSRLKLSERKSAAQSYKERLKERFKKEKAKLALKELTRESTSNRRSFTPREASAPEKEEGHKTYRSRVPRARSFRSRHEEVERVDEEQEEQKSGRSSTGFGSRSRSRPSRRQTSRSGIRSRGTQARNNIKDSIKEQTSGRRSSSKFTPSRKSSYGSRDRYSKKDSSDSSSVEEQSVNQPLTTRRPKTNSKNKPKIEFKKFNRFQRPDLRKTLFRSKLFEKRAGLKKLGEEKKKEEDLEFSDHESAPSALVISTVDDENILQNLDSDELRFSRAMTTLTVSTIYPEETPEEFLEVATIRSPYTFNIEDDQKSTRFITVTRTNTKPAEISPTSTFTSVAASTISPTPSSVFKHTPLFDTASIPAPENILASTPAHLAIEGSSDIEILPALTIASSLHHATPPLKTVTESFTTDEVLTKRSILPVVMGTDTSLLTLSQTYSITKVVTAIKTIPPMELYEFSPQHSFADFDNLFEEAGSENRESLLPGELEFSDQDNFGLDGPTPIRVAPPQGFLKEDLDVAKHDLIHKMEKHHNPEIFEFKSPPSLDSSFLSPSPSAQAPTQAPGLDLGSLSGLGVTPEQLLYLQLLQNPLAALGLGGKQVVTESSPIYKTEPVVESSVIQLFLGAKEFFTTLSSTVGFTTKTDYVLSTRTVSGGGLGGLAALQGLQPKRINQAPALGGLLGGGIKIISSPVTRNTVITETNTEEFKVIFRNKPTYTTLTSTTLVTTQVVSFVTQTVTSNPLAGLLG